MVIWSIERWRDKTGQSGITLKCGAVAVANMIGQIDDSELERARFIVSACNAAIKPDSGGSGR